MRLFGFVIERIPAPVEGEQIRCGVCGLFADAATSRKQKLPKGYEPRVITICETCPDREVVST